MAHEEVSPPKPVSTPAAPWPDGKAEIHDVIVPVVLMVNADGGVEDVVIEASVGEAFDRIALSTARTFTFEPARDSKKARRARVRSVVRFLGSAEPEIPSPAAAPPPAVSPAIAKPETATPQASAPSVAPAEPKAAASVPSVRINGDSAPRSASEKTVDRPTIAAAPHRTASDLLLTVPGVYVSQHSGEGKAHQIFFRGFDAVHGQDMEIWAGGAPVNDVSNIHGQGYADLHFMMPEIVKSVRALPGNYDPSQGDFAVAGSLRFDLGYAEPGATAKAELGSFGTRRFFLGYHPRDDSDATFAAAEIYGTDGFGPSRAARRASAIAQVERPLGDGVTARLLATTYAGRFDSAGVVRISDIESGAIDRFDTYDSKQGGFSTRTQLVSTFRRETEMDTWSLAPYVVFRSLGLRSNFTGTLYSPEGDSIEQRNDAITAGATSFYRRQVRLFSRHDSIDVGFSMRHDRIEQTQHRLSLLDDHITDDAQTPGVDAKVFATDVGGYFDLALHPVRRVALRGGLRGDGLFYAAEDRASDPAGGRTRSSAGAVLSPHATLDVAILPGFHGLASYGEGFRSPQARLLAEGETTPFTRVRSFEVGARYAHGRALVASAAYFHTALSDDILFDPATARNELVPATARDGLALTLASRPVPWFLSSTSFTYTHAAFTESGGIYEKGALLPYIPGVVVRSDVSYTPRLGRLLDRNLDGRAGFGLTYAGQRALPYSEQGHDTFLVDALAELRLREVAVGVEVYNLLNAEWFDGEFVYPSRWGGGSADLVPQRHVSVGAPRTILATVSVCL
jgi:TonB family protein